jgi:putative glutamine amidotransferase
VAEGALPWLVPLLPEDENTLRGIYEQLDGIFLTGGIDVEPSHYGEERSHWVQEIDPARDWTELRLVRWAMAEHKPIFGVCRGHQLINVAAGGTLYQDVREQHPEAVKHDYFSCSGQFARDELTHAVEVVRDSHLGHILGLDRVPVNSMHHQGVKELGRGLKPTAFAPDGLVEGFEADNGHFLIGVQWHPEELVEKDEAMRRLFTTFLNAAREYRRHR